MRIVIGRPRSIWRRFLDAIRGVEVPVEYCARCGNPKDGDPTMRARSARRCTTVTYCDGPYDFVVNPAEGKPLIRSCYTKTLVWS